MLLKGLAVVLLLHLHSYLHVTCKSSFLICFVRAVAKHILILCYKMFNSQ